MKKTKGKVHKGQKVESTKDKRHFNYDSLGQHFKEPLLIISILVFLISAVLYYGIDYSNIVAIGLFVLFILAGYIVSLYSKNRALNEYLVGFLLMLFLTAVFAWFSSERLTLAPQPNYTGARDYATFTLFFGMLSLIYMLWLHNLVRAGAGAMTVIFVITLMIHITPAFTPHYATMNGKYLSALDSYYYYRHTKTIANTGFVPENENKVYPKIPVSIDSEGNLDSIISFSTKQFLAPVLMGSLTTLFKNYGYSAQDIAIIYPGVFAALSVIVFYLLIKELFWDMRPYNYAAAVLGAFMLMVNPSFASRAIATNCEDDVLGMFLLISTFFLFAFSYRKKSILLSILAGFAFLTLNLAWSGYSYAIIVMGIFGMLYALASALNNKNALEHLPYFIIPMLISRLEPLVLHAMGKPPVFSIPPYIFLVPFGGTIALAFLLEIVRGWINKEKPGETVITGSPGEKLEAALKKYSVPVGIVLLLFSTYFVFVLSTPETMINYVVTLVAGAKQTEIIGMTTAEQRALCDSLDGPCLKDLMFQFGIGVLFGIGMILVLFYFVLFKRSFGAAFILAWGLPMLYGVVYRSQFQFTASVPIIALGATIGLVLPLSKKDLQGFRVISVVVLLCMMGFFTMFPVEASNGNRLPTADMSIVGPYGGAYPMYMGPSKDRYLWQPTFEWLANQSNNAVTLTWWDYGHWIAAISDRISILDNTKEERFMVQDIARFHVVEENETEALKIAKKYNTTYVVIDWTMIGKSAAPHFIGTSGLDGWIPLERIGAKIECTGSTDCSNAIKTDGYAAIPTGGENEFMIDLTSDYLIDRIAMDLQDSGNNVLYSYRVESSLDGINWTTVLDKTQGQAGGEQDESFTRTEARYVRFTDLGASSGTEFRVSNLRIYNPRREGSSWGYGECKFSPGSSVIKPQIKYNEDGEAYSVSSLVYPCTTGGVLLFELIDPKYSTSSISMSDLKVYYGAVDPSTGRVARVVPWESWMKSSKASILGVQSMDMILWNSLSYEYQPEYYLDPYWNPSINSFIYVPYIPQDPSTGETYNMNNVMMTKLYLGDYLEEYQSRGLADPSIQRSKYFELVEGFEGNTRDYSNLAFVRVYKVNYPEDME